MSVRSPSYLSALDDPSDPYAGAISAHERSGLWEPPRVPFPYAMDCNPILQASMAAQSPTFALNHNHYKQLQHLLKTGVSDGDSPYEGILLSPMREGLSALPPKAAFDRMNQEQNRCGFNACVHPGLLPELLSTRDPGRLLAAGDSAAAVAQHSFFQQQQQNESIQQHLQLRHFHEANKEFDLSHLWMDLHGLTATTTPASLSRLLSAGGTETSPIGTTVKEEIVVDTPPLPARLSASAINARTRRGCKKPLVRSDAPDESLALLDTVRTQAGCRSVQGNLARNPACIEPLFLTFLPVAADIAVDPFGNYLAQELVSRLSATQLSVLLQRLVYHSLEYICTSPHGTHVVQALIVRIAALVQVSRRFMTQDCEGRVAAEIALQTLRRVLEPLVACLIRDAIGGYVIERCIEHFSASDVDFVYEGMRKHAVGLAMHRHGCCVLQRTLALGSPEQQFTVVFPLTQQALRLSQHPFGNYVLQHVLGLSLPYISEQVAVQLTPHIAALSQQKFASNVVEGLIRRGSPLARHLVIAAVVGGGQQLVVKMLSDRYANYVIQTAYNLATGKQRQEIYQCIKDAVPELHRSKIGRWILPRFLRRVLADDPHSELAVLFSELALDPGTNCAAGTAATEGEEEGERCLAVPGDDQYPGLCGCSGHSDDEDDGAECMNRNTSVSNNSAMIPALRSPGGIIDGDRLGSIVSDASCSSSTTTTTTTTSTSQKPGSKGSEAGVGVLTSQTNEANSASSSSWRNSSDRTGQTVDCGRNRQQRAHESNTLTGLVTSAVGGRTTVASASAHFQSGRRNLQNAAAAAAAPKKPPRDL